MTMSCNEPTRASFLIEPEHRLHTLEVNHPTVNLALVAPYDTVTLSAIARNVLNDPLPDTIPVTFSTNASQVAVTPAGLVRALAQTSTSGIKITLSATYRGVTQTADVQIVVTNVAEPPRMDSFSFGRDITDTLQIVLSTGFGKPGVNLVPVAKTSTGAVIPRVIYSSSIETRSSDISVWIVRAHVYGVTMRDSVIRKYRSEPDFASVFLFDTMTASPSEIELYRGGDVYWVNSSSRNEIGITFDDPENVKAPSPETMGALLFGWWLPDSGNIAPFMRDTLLSPGDDVPLPAHKSMVRGRSFPKPGRYHWRTTRSPLVEGTIVVR